MLEVRDLSCGYGGRTVVHNISFTLPAGRRLVILGPNGCGKTTLLRALTGFLPFAGEASLDGRPLAAMSPRERGRGVAMLTQMSAASFSFSVWETVLMGRYPHLGRGVFAAPDSADRAVAENCLRRLGLWDQREKPITELSGGQLQRVLLARTFAQTPKVILLDEPTNHLDLKYQAELVAQLKSWTGGPGRAAVGVFHDLTLALDFADTVLLMEAGRAVYLGDADKLDPALLSRVFDLDIPAYMRSALRRWEEMGG